AFARILCSCFSRKYRRRHRNHVRICRRQPYMGTTMVLAPATLGYSTVNQL
ncbi:hypothetical protein M8J76_014683, partial [Diaphorina citri]